jgi:hypothetical protein
MSTVLCPVLSESLGSAVRLRIGPRSDFKAYRFLSAFTERDGSIGWHQLGVETEGFQ